MSDLLFRRRTPSTTGTIEHSTRPSARARCTVLADARSSLQPPCLNIRAARPPTIALGPLLAPLRTVLHAWSRSFSVVRRRYARARSRRWRGAYSWPGRRGRSLSVPQRCRRPGRIYAAVAMHGLSGGWSSDWLRPDRRDEAAGRLRRTASGSVAAPRSRLRLPICRALPGPTQTLSAHSKHAAALTLRRHASHRLPINTPASR